MDNFSGIKDYLYKEHKKEFDLSYFILDTARQLLDDKEFSFPNEDVFKRIVFFLNGKACKTFKSIVILCKNGHGEDAFILTRVLLETLINIKYINKDPVHRAILYAEYDAIIRMKSLEKLKKHEEEYLKLQDKIGPKEEEVKKEYQRIKQKYASIFGKREDRWSGKSIGKMAEEVGLGWYYDITYWLASQFTHSAPSITRTYVSLLDGKLNIDVGPSKNYISHSLILACDIFLRILERVNSVFELKNEKEIKRAIDEFELLKSQ